MVPHRILQTRAADGACVQSYETSSYAPLNDLRAAYPTLALHGSATATRYGDGTYLALLHAKDAAGKYTTFAYKFRASPPFDVVAVSRPLPLAGVADANFASGLMLSPGTDKVVVSYGARDAEARALVMPVAHLEYLFDACAPPPPPPPPPLSTPMPPMAP